MSRIDAEAALARLRLRRAIERRVLIGDCRETLKTLPAGSVHMVVTSPPYWGLRAYLSDDHDHKSREIGSERAPEEYVTDLVEVMRAVRRVLRDDGVAWINIGDSFANGGGVDPYRVTSSNKRMPQQGRAPVGGGLKPGDLVGIPWRLALALQADGWWLRSDVVWTKRNCMPESVKGWRWERCRVKTGVKTKSATSQGVIDAGLIGGLESVTWYSCPGCPKCAPNDGYVLRRGSWRPTRSHEHVFMLAKSERYFSDGEGVREQCSSTSHGGPNVRPGARAIGLGFSNGMSGALGQWTAEQKASGRNLRDVWRLSSTPSKIRHFAMMPPALVEKCLRSGPVKVCSACGAPWARVVDRARTLDGQPLAGGWRTNSLTTSSTTLGFRPTCPCAADPCPPTVLDPFLGAGTTAGVAEALGWRWIGCELSAEYATLVPKRIAEVRAWFDRQKLKVALASPDAEWEDEEAEDVDEDTDGVTQDDAESWDDAGGEE